jgi:PPIC-type PPIASE domain
MTRVVDGTSGRRWRREPLVWFLLLAAAVFALHVMAGRVTGPRADTIEVTAARIDELKAGFERTWARAPSDDEVTALIEDHVRTVVLAREAVAMGLDRDDTMIRRHLRMRMEVLAGDMARVEPTEQELEAYLAAHPAAFAVEPRYSFTQVYLNPSRRGERLEADAARLVAVLNGPDAPREPAALGDGALLEPEQVDVTFNHVAGLFGKGFADELSTLAPGRWHGPIASGYGLHVVRIHEREAPRAPRLADVRDAVRREWTADRTQRGKHALYDGLRRHYTVVFDPEARHADR